MFSTLINRESVAENWMRDDWVVVDCRFSLSDPELGRRAYEEAHIPGAIYAHLDDDLCGLPLTDHGRHPLPAAQVMSERFSRKGIDGTKQVVVYDDANGAIASRLWWMLQYMGHSAAAVLDGGWNAWQEAQLPTRPGVEVKDGIRFTGVPQAHRLVVLDDLENVPLLVDSRAPERYRGEVEPIDPRAGHIPGAVNHFFQLNWSEDGRYLSAEQLERQFNELLGDQAAEEVTFHCGSGVTACVNLLSLAHAGMGNGRLFVGSWSEWCRDPARPIMTGE